MKLTGKCLYYFTIQYGTIDHLPESCQNAIIIEFFDSVGIYISVVREFECFESYVNSKCVSVYSESRPEATNAAIEKANVIYNESKL